MKMLHEVLTQFFNTYRMPKEGMGALLGVPPSAIPLWMEGYELPSASHLGAIVLLASQDNKQQETYAQLNKVLDLPYTEVVLQRQHRWQAGIGPTLRHYLLTPRKEGMLALLNCLPPGEQETLLIEFGKLTHARLVALESQSTTASFTRSIP